MNKPIAKNRLVPQVQFTTAIELSDQQTATLNRLVLGSKDLTDDEALDLWLSLNPYVQSFDHTNPRDIYSGLRYVALAKLPAVKPEPEPPYSAELLNSVRSDIETDTPNCICW